MLWSAARSTRVNADLARKGCVKVYIWLARKNKLKKLVCVFFGMKLFMFPLLRYNIS